MFIYYMNANEILDWVAVVNLTSKRRNLLCDYGNGDFCVSYTRCVATLCHGLIYLFIYLLLRSLSEAVTLFLTDRVGPGRFIICGLSRSDFFRWRWFWVVAVRWISGSSFRIVRAQPTWSLTELSSIRWVYYSFFNSVILLNAISSIAGSSHQGHERFSEISSGMQCFFYEFFSAVVCTVVSSAALGYCHSWPNFNRRRQDVLVKNILDTDALSLIYLPNQGLSTVQSPAIEVREQNQPPVEVTKRKFIEYKLQLMIQPLAY